MTNKEVILQIKDLEAFQEIANTFQQVASMRMRKIKDTVIQNRSFYQSLSHIYLETYLAYFKVNKTLYNKNGNGKSAAVLLTSNTGLYGNVVKDVFDKFIKDHAQSQAELVVVGRLGKMWLNTLEIKKPFKYFDLHDGTDNLDAGIKAIFDYIADYSEVSVYHGIFRNIVEQEPKITVITQKPEVKKDEEQTLSFLFEPSIDKVLENFEKQLLYSFFDQSVSESSLAKFGSRMISLDSASQKISKTRSSMQMSAIKMKHQKQSKRQLEQISGATLWE